MKKNFEWTKNTLRVKVSPSNSKRAFKLSGTPDSYFYLFAQNDKTDIENNKLLKMEGKTFSFSISSTMEERAKKLFRLIGKEKVLMDNLSNYKKQNKINFKFVSRTQNQFSLHIGERNLRKSPSKLYIDSLLASSFSNICIDFDNKKFDIEYITDDWEVDDSINFYKYIWFSTKKFKPALKNIVEYMYIKYKAIKTSNFKRLFAKEFKISDSLLDHLYSFKDNYGSYFDHTIRNNRGKAKSAGYIIKKDDGMYYATEKLSRKKIEVLKLKIIDFLEVAEKFSSLAISLSRKKLPYVDDGIPDLDISKMFVKKNGSNINNDRKNQGKFDSGTSRERAVETGYNAEEVAKPQIIKLLINYAREHKISFDPGDLSSNIEDDGKGADFWVDINDKTLYFEVKKVNKFEGINFIISAKEIKVALKNIENYYFIFVDDSKNVKKVIARDIINLLEYKSISFSASARESIRDRNIDDVKKLLHLK